ncbi:MAG: hypothetical protein AAGG69_04630 [Pseudomonadota bacterium]
MLQDVYRKKRVAVSARIAMPVIASMLLAGCVVSGPPPSIPPSGVVPPATPGIEGSWRSTENLYTASFFNSATQWNEIGTGALLISGSYSRVTASDYALQLTSAVSGQTRAANCRLANTNTLNCTRDDGQQFSMVRATGTV